MSTKLLIAIISITLALVFYTVGVWMERFQKKLMVRHFVLFVCGLICDSLGTGIMTTLKDSASVSGGIVNVHGITGVLAIALMFLHAIWALIVLMKKDEKAQANFHKFSIFVWCIWLIPYFIGMMMGMGK